MHKKVSVITPFFQRQPGLLRKAIESVAAQKNVSAKVEVVVVDDGSPTTAESEVEGLALPPNVTVRIVKQSNRGCYPTCNVALNNVGEDSDYIAFLDSDDVWFESHLANAIWALEKGYDWYFSDFYQLNQTVSAFRRGGRLNLADHKKLEPSEAIYDFSVDMFDQVLKGNVLGTSTIVYSRAKLGDLRYLEDFRHTGAEYILWLNMAVRSNRIAFSMEPECRYGGGVNIFSEASWGTDKFLTVRQDEMKYRKYILGHFTVSQDQRRHLKKKIQESRFNFCLAMIHNVLHNGMVAKSILMQQLRADPWTFGMLLLTPFILGARQLRAKT